MFGLFGRTRSIRESSCPVATRPCPADPAAQVALVYQAMEKLDEVRRMVSGLPEVPIGDRQTLLAQLASTSDSLRALSFLDAIY